MERAIDLLRLESGTRAQVFALLNDLEGEIVAALTKVDPGDPARATPRKCKARAGFGIRQFLAYCRSTSIPSHMTHA